MEIKPRKQRERVEWKICVYVKLSRKNINLRVVVCVFWVIHQCL
jgi:hypothetical protein